MEIVLVEVNVAAEMEAEKIKVTHLITRILHAIVAKRKAILLISQRSQLQATMEVAAKL